MEGGWGGCEISFVLDGVFLMHASMSCTEYSMLHDLKVNRY